MGRFSDEDPTNPSRPFRAIPPDVGGTTLPVSNEEIEILRDEAVKASPANTPVPSSESQQVKNMILSIERDLSNVREQASKDAEELFANIALIREDLLWAKRRARILGVAVFLILLVILARC